MRSGTRPKSSTISTRFVQATAPSLPKSLKCTCFMTTMRSTSVRACTTASPNGFAAPTMRHGQGLGDDDRLVVILDPFNTGRGGYRFETNANGVRHDALYENVSSFPERVDGDMGRGRLDLRERMDSRVGNSVQDSALRSGNRHMGVQLRAGNSPPGRRGGLGLAQPQLQPQHPGTGDRLRGNGSGVRTRHRAFSVDQPLEGFSRRQ